MSQPDPVYNADALCVWHKNTAFLQEPRFREAAWPHEQRKPAKKRTRDAADAAFRHGSFPEQACHHSGGSAR